METNYRQHRFWTKDRTGLWVVGLSVATFYYFSTLNADCAATMKFLPNDGSGGYHAGVVCVAAIAAA